MLKLFPTSRFAESSIIQTPLFDFEAFVAERGKDRLVMVLEALPGEKLITTLEKERWTGRKGYSVRGMWSALIAGVLYNCHSIAEVARLLKGNKDIRLTCGFSKDKLPGEDALARFVRKLAAHEGLLEECFTGLVEKLRGSLSGFGAKLAVDATDIEAYSNGHRQSPSDPDASWGVKGARTTSSDGTSTARGKERELYRWFGYKLHLIVDAVHELPLAFIVTPASESDTTQMKPLLKKAGVDKLGHQPQAVIADKGYDSKDNCLTIFRDCQAAPIIPLIEKPGWETPDVCNARGTPTCSCGLRWCTGDVTAII